MNKRQLWSLMAILAVTIGTATATPVSYNLLDLVQQNGSFTVGDKTFSNFDASLTIFGEGTATPPSLSGITVTPITVSGMYGVQLSGGIFVSCAAGTCPTTWDLNVSWDVAAASPFLIDGVHLSFNGTASNFPSSIASVTETIAVGANIVGSGSVFNDPPGPLSIFIPLNGAYSSIRITKDILLVANAIEENFATATLSDVDQLYHQVVPEPGTYALIGAGLLGLGLLRRRMS